MAKLEIEKSQNSDETIISLTGTIDEDSNFINLKEITTKTLVFDFEFVKYINSCGIREWINYIDQIKPEMKVFYRNCPEIVIEQINMVDGLLKDNNTIDTFFAPYFCPHCDKEKRILLDSNKLENATAPEIKCDECENVLEFDAIESQYLTFLNKKNS